MRAKSKAFNAIRWLNFVRPILIKIAFFLSKTCLDTYSLLVFLKKPQISRYACDSCHINWAMNEHIFRQTLTKLVAIFRQFALGNCHVNKFPHFWIWFGTRDKNSWKKSLKIDDEALMRSAVALSGVETFGSNLNSRLLWQRLINICYYYALNWEQKCSSGFALSKVRRSPKECVIDVHL